MSLHAQPSLSSALPPVPLLRRAPRGGGEFDPRLPRSRMNVPFPVLEVPQEARPPVETHEVQTHPSDEQLDVPTPHPVVEEPAPAPIELPEAAPAVRKSRFGLVADVGAAAYEDGGWDMGADGGGIEDYAGARKGGVERQAVQLEEVTGMLERVTVIGNWAIGSMLGVDRISKKVTGEVLRDLIEGNEYVFRGKTRTSDRYGESLEVVSTTAHISENPQAIARFIWKNFKGIGPAKADRFVREQIEAAGDDQDARSAAMKDLRTKLLDDPWSLDLTSLAKNAQFNGGSDDLNAPTLLYVQRDLSLRLGAIAGMRENVLKDIAKYLVAKMEGPKAKGGIDPGVAQKCWADLAKDPYAPVRTVAGYGFVLADSIGKSMSIPRDAPVRLGALVAHALAEGCTAGGHVYLSKGQLEQRISTLDPRVSADQAIECAHAAGSVEICDEFGAACYYTAGMMEVERSVARRIAHLCQPSKPQSELALDALETRVREAARKVLGGGREIDDSQVGALVGIMTAQVRLHTLTAGPGCGKTALMEILVEVLKDKEFCFMAPTGKAAKVLSNRLQSHGLRATTIHSTLMGSGAADFRVNEDDPLPSDIVVVDESSMTDLALADGVLAAVGPQSAIIFLGDPDQLPSIAPGSFLRDVMRIKYADHQRLQTTHRNQGGILDIVKQVREGGFSAASRSGDGALTFSHRLGDAAVERGEIVTRYMDAVNKYGFSGVALLMSKRKGDVNEPDWNTTYFNAVLRDLCNPNADRIPGTRLHVGDRIIIRANMAVARAGQGQKLQEQHARAEADDSSEWEEPESEVPEERVVNGDTGVITSFTRDEKNSRNLGAKFIQLKLDDGRDVDFPGPAVEALAHSYALTVHAGQGSEYRSVIAVATPGAATFINRTMLYTAISRASRELHIHGDEATLKRIAATAMPRRNSALYARVMREFGEEAAEIDNDAQERTGRRGRFSCDVRQLGS